MTCDLDDACANFMILVNVVAGRARTSNSNFATIHTVPDHPPTERRSFRSFFICQLHESNVPLAAMGIVRGVGASV